MKEIEESTSAFYVIAYPYDPDDPEIVELSVSVATPSARVVSAPSRFAPPPTYADRKAIPGH